MQNDTIKEISDDILKLAPRIHHEIVSEFKKVKAGESVEYETDGPNPQDMATNLDHQIGKIYIDEIFSKYKKILKIDSEEESERLGNGQIILRFDPLDGTKHFFKGIPMLGSTFALIKDGVTEFAMVLDIFSENIYHAYKNGGAYLNGKRIKVSDHGIKDDFSFLMYESPNSRMFINEPDKFATLNGQLEVISKNAYRTRNIGLAALSICLVADGSCPAYVDFSGTTKLYDVEAAAMIALEAGAIVGDTYGNRDNKLDHSEQGVKKLTGNLLVANPKAFDEISKLISKNS